MPRAPTLTALLMRPERVILPPGLEVIVLIPFRGRAGAGPPRPSRSNLSMPMMMAIRATQDGYAGAGSSRKPRK